MRSCYNAAAAISLRAASSNHSAASGICRAHARFYLHVPTAPAPPLLPRSFGAAWSRFRAASAAVRPQPAAPCPGTPLPPPPGPYTAAQQAKTAAACVYPSASPPLPELAAPPPLLSRSFGAARSRFRAASAAVRSQPASPCPGTPLPPPPGPYTAAQQAKTAAACVYPSASLPLPELDAARPHHREIPPQ
uniref:uncharacterized protein LOC129134398 n=1 Tax=Agelaius phoeniceus TaxID=39638 RepID=UPI0023ED1EB3|nr:uncharacterized protein LOC129134398 [Agelaius phoeniceus]